MDEIIGEPVHGILGADFFKGLIVEINYKKQYLRLFDPKHFKEENLTPTPSGSGFCRQQTVHRRAGYYARRTKNQGKDVDGYRCFHLNAYPQWYRCQPNTATQCHPEIWAKAFPAIFQAMWVASGNSPFLVFHSNRWYPIFREYNADLFTILPPLKETALLEILSWIDSMWSSIILMKKYMLSRKKYNRHFAFDRSGIVVFAHGKDLKQFVVSDVIESSPRLWGWRACQRHHH